MLLIKHLTSTKPFKSVFLLFELTCFYFIHIGMCFFNISLFYCAVEANNGTIVGQITIARFAYTAVHNFVCAFFRHMLLSKYDFLFTCYCESLILVLDLSDTLN